RRGAIGVEELDRAGHHRPEVAALLDPPLDELVDGGDLDVEAIAAFEITCGALLVEEPGAMRGQLDDLLTAPAPLVLDDELIVQEANDAIVRAELDGGAGEGVVHRVAVAVEGDERLL